MMFHKIVSLAVILSFVFSNVAFALPQNTLRQMTVENPDLGKEIGNDLGGPKATNPITNQAIKDWIEQGKVVKLRLKDNVFYIPTFIPYYTPGKSNDFSRENVLKKPFLGSVEIATLRAYLNQIGIINLDEVTIGIVKGQAMVNPTGDDKFSLVHAGEREKIIYIGEFLLRDMLSKRMGDDPHAVKIFTHDVKHLTDPEAALAEHDTQDYKNLVKEVSIRCEELTAIAKGPTTPKYFDDGSQVNFAIWELVPDTDGAQIRQKANHTIIVQRQPDGRFGIFSSGLPTITERKATTIAQAPETQPRNPEGTFAQKPGGSTEEVLKTIQTNPQLQREEGFTLSELINVHKSAVTPQTLRRDLNELADAGLLEVEQAKGKENRYYVTKKGIGVVKAAQLFDNQLGPYLERALWKTVAAIEQEPTVVAQSHLAQGPGGTSDYGDIGNFGQGERNAIFGLETKKVGESTVLTIPDIDGGGLLNREGARYYLWDGKTLNYFIAKYKGVRQHFTNIRTKQYPDLEPITSENKKEAKLIETFLTQNKVDYPCYIFAYIPSDSLLTGIKTSPFLREDDVSFRINGQETHLTRLANMPVMTLGLIKHNPYIAIAKMAHERAAFEAKLQGESGDQQHRTGLGKELKVVEQQMGFIDYSLRRPFTPGYEQYQELVALEKYLSNEWSKINTTRGTGLVYKLPTNEVYGKFEGDYSSSGGGAAIDTAMKYLRESLEINVLSDYYLTETVKLRIRELTEVALGPNIPPQRLPEVIDLLEKISLKFEGDSLYYEKIKGRPYAHSPLAFRQEYDRLWNSNRQEDRDKAETMLAMERAAPDAARGASIYEACQSAISKINLGLRDTVRKLPPYTGAGDTAIHTALDDAENMIKDGNHSEAENLLNGLIADLQEAEGSGDIVPLMAAYNQKYPSDIQPDILVADIPASIEQAKTLLYYTQLTTPAEKEAALEQLISVANVVDKEILTDSVTWDNLLARFGISTPGKTGLIISIDAVAEGLGAVLVGLANRGVSIYVVIDKDNEVQSKLLHEFNKRIPKEENRIEFTDSLRDAAFNLEAYVGTESKIRYVGTEENIANLPKQFEEYFIITPARRIIEQMKQLGFENLKTMFEDFQQTCVRLGLV